MVYRGEVGYGWLVSKTSGLSPSSQGFVDGIASVPTLGPTVNTTLRLWKLRQGPVVLRILVMEGVSSRVRTVS